MINLFNAASSQNIRKAARRFHTTGNAGELLVDGVNIAYWRAGAGEKSLVFVHGNSACKEVFHQQVKSFADSGYSVLAIDLPGHGASSNAVNPEAQYTIPGYALLIKRVLDRLGIHRPIIVGWSLGGHIALEMAGRGYDLAGVLIVGTPPAGPGLTDMAEAFLPSPVASVTMREDAPDKEVRAYAENLYGVLDPIADVFINAALRTEGRARRIMGENWGGGEEGCHQRTVAAGWRQPICVVHGADDPFISYQYLQEVEWRNLWRDEIIVFEDCGHAAFIEHPDRFNSVLKKFIADEFQQ
jgi:pimeloyl-ACP methyl ester carboxylesterase